jgi:hypothetical protein
MTREVVGGGIGGETFIPMVLERSLHWQYPSYGLLRVSRL